MKILCSSKLSPHRYETPEGYLVCKDCVIARCGKQTYLKSEVYDLIEDEDEYIDIDRKPKEVFAKETLASFEGKPLTIDHPDQPVTPDNYKDLAVGNIYNVRQGKFEGEDVILADITVYDSKAISLIKGKKMEELSCGYDCDITEGDRPEQVNIRGNHVALCESGRAGIAKIRDSKKSKIDTDELNFIVDYHYKTDEANGLDMSAFLDRLMIEYVPNELSRQPTEEERKYLKAKAKEILAKPKEGIRDQKKPFVKYKKSTILGKDSVENPIENVKYDKNMQKKIYRTIRIGETGEEGIKDNILKDLPKYGFEIENYRLSDRGHTIEVWWNYKGRTGYNIISDDTVDSDSYRMAEDLASAIYHRDVLKDSIKDYYDPYQPNPNDDEYELEEELELPSNPNSMTGMYNGIFYKYVGDDIYFYRNGEFIQKANLDKLLKMYPPKKRKPGKNPMQMFISQFIARDPVADSFAKDASVELDFDGSEAEALRLASKHDCSVKKITSMNKFNGYPTYRFFGTKEDLKRLAKEYGMDEEDIEYFIGDGATEQKGFVIRFPDGKYLGDREEVVDKIENAKRFETQEEAKPFQKKYWKGSIEKAAPERKEQPKEKEKGILDRSALFSELKDVDFEDIQIDDTLGIADIYFEDEEKRDEAVEKLYDSYEIEKSDEEGIKLRVLEKRKMKDSRFECNMRKGPAARELKEYLKDRQIDFKMYKNKRFVHFSMPFADSAVIGKIQTINERIARSGFFDNLSKRYYVNSIKAMEKKIEELKSESPGKGASHDIADYESKKEALIRSLEKDIEDYKRKIDEL